MCSDVSKHVVLYTPLHAHWLPILEFQPCRTTITRHGLKLLAELVIQLCLCLFLLGDFFCVGFQVIFVRILNYLAEVIRYMVLGRLLCFLRLCS